MAMRRKGQNTVDSSTTRLQISAAAVASSEDLLIEILMRLPVRTLVRFKFVCKQWHSLISDPKFTMSHARRNHRSNGLLLKSLTQVPGLSLVPLEGYQPPRVLPFNFLNNQGTDVLHSCKGFLCYSVAHLDDSMLTSYYVCHLASGHSTRIRVFDAPSVTNVRAVLVAFDPLKSVHYKVIFVRQISSSLSNRLLKIDIYSSETQSWKPAKEVLIVPYDVGFNNEGVYLNGAIYWYDQTRTAVWYFVLGAEYLDRMPAPQDLEDWLKISTVEYFGESGGNLHLIVTCRPLITLLTIYEMQKDKSGWFVKYQCDLDVVANAFPRMVCAHYSDHYVYRLLCLVEGETQEETNLVLAVPGEVISYNVKNNALTTLCDFGMFGVTDQGNGAYQFMEILGIETYQYVETLARI